MADWYVLQQNSPSPSGPSTTDDVVQGIRSGAIRPGAQLCRVGETAWGPLSAVPEFAAALRDAAPAPPVPPPSAAPGFGAPPQIAYVQGPPPAPVSDRREGTSDKSRTVYVLLGILLGGLGIHNFYAGHHVRGAAQLLLTVVLGWWLIIPLIFVGIWVLVEVFTVTEDGQGRRLS